MLNEKSDNHFPVSIVHRALLYLILHPPTQFATNSFTLSSPSLSPIGVAISPLTALLNHSCVPNAVVVFPGGSLFNNGKSMIVNALRDIKPGEEVLTAYIDVSLPYKMRQKQLKENYHFTCRCELCEKEERDESVDPRSAVIHPGCQKNGTGKMPGEWTLLHGYPLSQQTLTRPSIFSV